VAATFDRGRMSLYVNGKLVGRQALVAHIPNVPPRVAGAVGCKPAALLRGVQVVSLAAGLAQPLKTAEAASRLRNGRIFRPATRSSACWFHDRW